MSPLIGILCSGEVRYIHRDLWDALEGPKPPPGFANNGCTCSPDYTPDGKAVWPACTIHDFHYSGAVVGMSRREADRILRTNIWRALRYQGVVWFRAGYYALLYWRAVRRLGGRHYRTAPPERREAA